jgi:hypothetical protein
MDFTDEEFSISSPIGKRFSREQTKATKSRFRIGIVAFVPFCSREIRVIPAIRGKIFARLRESDRLRFKKAAFAA